MSTAERTSAARSTGTKTRVRYWMISVKQPCAFSHAICSAGAPLISPLTLRGPKRRGSATGVLVAGMPASSGTAAGPVRVLRQPADFGALLPGEILVCPYTNPSWTPLFALAAAVVVDTGGAGSHAAIVAREYGIPAVMGTGDGTRVLTDGQRVLVDGTAGEVRRAGAPE